MNWPATVAGALVLVLVVLPGLAGEHLFRVIGGVSWREKDSRQFLRLLSFSVLGLTVYTMAAAYRGWYMPDYVVPSTFAPEFSSAQLPLLGVAYIGHWIGAALVGVTAAVASRITAKIASRSANRDAWDHFVRCNAPKHWVVVKLKNDETYAGQIEHADVAIEPEYRDVVLSEPYRYDDKMECYAVTFQQYLFLRGDDVASMAVVYSPEDKRVVPVGEMPFGEKPDVREETEPTTTAARHKSDQGRRPAAQAAESPHSTAANTTARAATDAQII